MPGRSISLINDEVYHVYNRGNDKRDIFLQPRDYKRFIQSFSYYQLLGPKPKFSNSGIFRESLDLSSRNKYVELICYCLMPNHFHFILKQLADGGISTFMSQLSNSYTKYFNTKYNRVGALLQGAFKAVHVDTEEQLMHLSRYIHLNPVVARNIRNINNYGWSSYLEYIFNKPSVCSIDSVLSLFSSSQAYQQFVENQVEYGRSLEAIKHLTIDEH